MEAAIWTDVIQVVVLIGGLIIGPIYIAVDIGDLVYTFNGKRRLVDLRWSWTQVVT